jgi:methylated-DNA-[protein]-cysteine S-methyltransferase
MDFISHYDSPIGRMTMASDGTHLIGLWFDGQKHFASTLDKECEERDDLPFFDQTCRWLDIYFSGSVPDFTPALLLRANVFRRRVWEILLTIPYGHTMTYGEIARNIARERNLTSMSAQAVGSAVSHNPISLIIPCHRVIGANGSLTGYAGGIERKKWLLEMEKTIERSKK